MNESPPPKIPLQRGRKGGPRKRVAYMSPLIPPEWIAAFGLEPEPVLPEGKGDVEMPGLCPFAKAFVHSIASNPEIDGAIFTTSCDQMRRARELLEALWRKPVFLFNAPKAVDSPNAVRLYGFELKRLGDFLVEMGGRMPTGEELTRTMIEFENRRQLIPEKAGARDGVPLMLLGGPMLRRHLPIYAMISESGGCVVADGTESPFPIYSCHSEIDQIRTRPARFDKRRLAGEPFEVLVEAYYPVIPTVDQRPNSRLYQWIEKTIKEQSVRGIIIRHFVWCDLWRAEVPRLRKWSPVPVLSLDVDEEETDEERLRSRISAFMEMLR